MFVGSARGTGRRCGCCISTLTGVRVRGTVCNFFPLQIRLGWVVATVCGGSGAHSHHCYLSLPSIRAMPTFCSAIGSRPHAPSRNPQASQACQTVDDCLCGLPQPRRPPRHAKPYLDDCLCGLPPSPQASRIYAKPYLDDRYAPRHVTPPPPPQAASSASGTRGSTLTPGRSHADRVHHLSLSRTPVALHVDPGASLVPGCLFLCKAGL